MAGIGFIILCFYEEKYEKGKEQLLQAVTFWESSGRGRDMEFRT
jgi:hypothetical protein